MDLRDDVRSYLDSHASEISRPIRVLDGGWSPQFIPMGWDQTQAEACGVDEEEATEKGITIISWASVTGATQSVIDNFPGGLFADGEDRPAVLGDYFSPNGSDAVEIIRTQDADGNDVPFAEVGDRNVFLYPMLGYLPEGELNFDEFFKRPIEVSLDEDLQGRIQEAQEEATKRHFFQIVSTSDEARISGIRGQIEEHENNIRQSTQQITAWHRDLRNERLNLDFILDRRDKSEEHWTKEWEQLNAHPKIVANGVSFEGDRELVINTKPLTLEHPTTGEIAPLGRFRCKFNFNTNEITLENLDNRRRDRDHPHVQRGHPCLGDVGPQISRFMGEGEIAGTFEYVLQFLESFNLDDDWGRFGHWWFSPEEETV